MSASLPARDAAARADPRAAPLALAIAHQALVAAQRAATVRDPRHALAARRAAGAFAVAVASLEALVLPDRAAALAALSRRATVTVRGTVTPAERAWVVGLHLLAAAARLHHRATAASRPAFGAGESAAALAGLRRGLSELEALVSVQRRDALQRSLAPSELSLNVQLARFAPTLCERIGRSPR